MSESEFRLTHIYEPVGMDQFDPKPHPGSQPIRPGSRVMKIGRQIGSGRLSFHHVVDEEGHHQQVMRNSLRTPTADERTTWRNFGARRVPSTPFGRVQAPTGEPSSDAMRWRPEDAEHEMAEWNNIIHNHPAPRPLSAPPGWEWPEGQPPRRTRD